MWFHIFQFSVLPSTVSFIEVVQCQSLAPKPVIFRCLYQAWENYTAVLCLVGATHFCP